MFSTYFKELLMLGKIKNFFRSLPSRITPVNLFISLMAFSATVYVIIYAIIGNGFFTDLFIIFNFPDVPKDPPGSFGSAPYRQPL